MPRPRVLFVCARNGGKSPMAAALLEDLAGGRVDVGSAGTSPGSTVNGLSAEVLAEVGLDVSGHVPRGFTDDDLRAADLVVVLGREAEVPAVAGTRQVTWELDEPSERGIEGAERMRLVRDDLSARVHTLLDELVDPV